MTPSRALLQVRCLSLLNDLVNGFDIDQSSRNLCAQLEIVKAEDRLVEQITTPSLLEEHLQRMTFEEYNDRVEGVGCD